MGGIATKDVIPYSALGGYFLGTVCLFCAAFFIGKNDN